MHALSLSIQNLRLVKALLTRERIHSTQPGELVEIAISGEFRTKVTAKVLHNLKYNDR